MLDHVLAWERWSTHVGIVLSAFGEPKTTARTVIPRKTVTDLLLKAAIRNSSSLLKISSSVFRIQSISRKRVHCCVPVLRPIHPFAIGVLLLVRRSQLRV